jgi:putative membrane protein
MAMGGADVIPGVSGGTIALITGIYEELISSIKSVDGDLIKLLLKMEFKEFWIRLNGNFLLTVFGGICISILSLAKLITYLMEFHPIPLWSFFFGLILVSAYYVMPQGKNMKSWVSLLIGGLLAYYITSLSQTQTPNEYWFVFIAGAIAICAMILPGISGSFILLIFGKYEFVLNAVKSFDIAVIAVFGFGCLIGLLSFAKLIDWLLKTHKNVTMSVLAGFMLGSLNKIWPWKLDLTGSVFVEGTSSNFINVLPPKYTLATNIPNQFLLGLILFVFAFVVVIGLERFGKKVNS